MQKKLIALAIAGLGLSGAAFAQSNVTVYGIVDVSYDITDNGDPTAGASGIRTSKISSNSSRLGFKGSEDLGGGLKAVFQIESAINSDSGAAAGTTLAGRNTFVGLAGGFGTVQLGHFDTPYKTATRALDPFGDYLGDNRNLMGKGTIGFDGRPDNIIAYISPTFGGGFTVTAAYVAGAEAAVTGGQDKGSAWSFNGTYSTGPWYATVAHERHSFGTAATGSIVSTAGAADKVERASKLGVGYKDAVWTLGFVYESVSDDFPAVATAGAAALPASWEHKAWTLAGTYTAGANVFKAAYTHAGDRADVSDTGAKQWAIGVDRILSKRTKLFAQYVKLSNEDKSSFYSLTGAGSTGSVTAKGAGADPSAWTFGMRHTF